MKHVLAALIIASMPLAAAPVFAADSAKESAASPEQQKELKKLMDAYGSGAMSAKDYKARKEAILAGKK